MHETYLQRALELAAERRGFCAPNPAVGAVVVKDNQIISSGYHWAAGQPHAEVVALNALSEQEACGATLYVTLEPCCHFGKTPPCTDLIIQRKISRVIYGFTDPNPQVAGLGAKQLQTAGINCEQVILPAINTFYRSYHYWQQTGLPWITAKIALSLDGKIAGASGTPVAITNNELRIMTHQSRKAADAILTTINTIKQDDPQLNVRLSAQIYSKPIYILDSTLQLPLTAKIFNTAKSLTIFHQSKIDDSKKQALLERGVRCIEVHRSKAGLDLAAVVSYVGKDGVHDLWIEAGGQCFQAFIMAKLIQRALIYVAPKWLGAEAQAAFSTENLLATAQKIEWRAIGDNAVCEVSWNS